METCPVIDHEEVVADVFIHPRSATDRLPPYSQAREMLFWLEVNSGKTKDKIRKPLKPKSNKPNFRSPNYDEGGYRSSSQSDTDD